jgi:hypothetical protein
MAWLLAAPASVSLHSVVGPQQSFLRCPSDVGAIEDGHFLGPHGVGMLDAVKEDEASNPLAITPLGGQGVMPDPEDLADLLHESHGIAPLLCCAVCVIGAISRELRLAC